ncbi:MAG: ABC transporter permease [bacterium]|nr:ABC transporter permease [bacterium]
MNFATIWIVYRKEFLDVLRDRRTLISMILLPLLIFPLMTVGMGSFIAGRMAKLEDRSSPILVVGSERAPGLLAQLKMNNGLQVIPQVSDTTQASQMLLDRSVQAVVIVPASFSEGFISDGSMFTDQKILIWSDKSNTESEIVERKVRKEVGAYKDSLVSRELGKRGLPRMLVEPFSIESQNRASSSKMAGAVLAMLLPYMVILLTMTGSTYSAIDMTAGEKERGTLETLLVCPATRLELVLGKFFTTMTVGMITAFLAMVSMTMTFLLPGSIFAKEMGGQLQLSFDPAAIILILLLLIPIAALFAAALIAIAINARSYKEAQSYVYPLIILVVIPAVASIMPGAGADTKMAFMPVLNVSLVLHDALMGTYDTNLILITFASSLVYAAISIFIAVRIFQKESVLLRV